MVGIVGILQQYTISVEACHIKLPYSAPPSQYSSLDIRTDRKKGGQTNSRTSGQQFKRTERHKNRRSGGQQDRRTEGKHDSRTIGQKTGGEGGWRT